MKSVISYINDIFLQIRKYLQVHDPGFFHFTYALKSLVVIGISVLISYLLFFLNGYGRGVLIWAAMTSLQVFFANSMMSSRTSKRLYLLIYVILVPIIAEVFSRLAQAGFDESHVLNILILVIPLIVLSFFIGMSRIYDIELYKMLIAILVSALLACLYVESGMILPAIPQIGSAFIGAFCAFISLILFDSSHAYGKYARIYFPMLLSNVINMMKNIDKKEFHTYKRLSLDTIDEMKQTLHQKGAIAKNTTIIKNIKRAIFYIYKIEDICLSISITRQYFINHKIRPLQNEIIHNLMQLRRIFSAKLPKLKQAEYDKIIHNTIENKEKNYEHDVILVNSIKILYNKMNSFWRVGNMADIAFVQKPKKTLKEFITALFDFKNAVYRFSFKYSIAIGSAVLVASLFHLQKGIWVSMSMISVIRPSMGEIGSIGKEYFLGAVIGIAMGIFLSSVTGGVVFFFLFAVAIFLIVYVRSFSYGLWTGCIMCAFVMMYSLIYVDFAPYVLGRLLDISIGIAIVFILFWVIWPNYTRDGFLPLLKIQNEKLESILDSLKLAQLDSGTNYYKLQNLEAELYQNLNNLSLMVKNAKSEKSAKGSALIKCGSDIVSILNSMIERTGELIQFCFSLDKENVKSDLYAHDIKVLQTRMQMINKLIANEEHYFKKHNEDRFLSDESNYFIWVVTDFFNLQNKMYDILNTNLNH